ncbi:RES family NAD+ phosphorylase [Mesorhizobium sp. CAU 1741]|uniref:RES family NAD+ phosphorylase n=1 Tax=Mesorhizobium sp. CAU 1741 TaxID=3140366 RepID=UPI00325C03FA
MTIRVGTRLHRIHARRFQAEEFNPGMGSSRFAPFASAGSQVPTMYAGTTFACAAYETIFHDIDPAATFKSVSMVEVEQRAVSCIEVDRDLKLARLFEPDLNRWGLTRKDLIDTPRSLYPQTSLWAAAIHDSDPTLDGMIWTSRRFDEEKCIILFGARLDPDSISVQSSEHFATSPGSLAALREAGQLAGITITI